MSYPTDAAGRQQFADEPIASSNFQGSIMGFESFRVELRGGRVTYPQADDAIQTLPHVHPDPQSIPMQGSKFYLVQDGRHVIELELMDTPVRLSCRFTLCHPPSVDAAFLGLVRELMTRLEMNAKICDDVRPEHSCSFSLDRFEDFSSIALSYIAKRRAEWMAMFGADQVSATTIEVHEQIILPRCQPRVSSPQ